MQLALMMVRPFYGVLSSALFAEWDLSPLDAAQMSRMLKDANDGSESRIYVFADSAYFSFVQNYLCIANRLEFQRLGWSVHVAATDATLAHRLSQWPEDIRFTVINLAPGTCIDCGCNTLLDDMSYIVFDGRGIFVVCCSVDSLLRVI